MKWTTHLSRLEAQAASCLALPMSEIAIVSIHDPRSEPPFLTGWHDVLQLAFNDITENIPGYVAPRLDHAAKIAQFIRQHKDRCIVAHCEAGISRSAAVCKRLVELGWSYNRPHETGLMFANPLLYSHLSKFIGGGLQQGTD